ncbi:MAG: Outer membrane protein assembly factor BamA [Verrucomicrobia subdivision 3 bacterium]|nr:Outer membrane protein assembly factor BamA [Limisphaerales bacterium]MCS1416647.1 Outer membrane protein assembly factor BamA [Limisphaerales bacterium]
MRYTLSRRWSTWAFLACWLPQVASQAEVPGQSVEQIEIRHVGPASVSDALIRANIQTSPGDTLSPAKINQDIKNLLRTGYFHNVNIAWDPGDHGVKLIYTVQGKPTLMEIEFSGNDKIKTSKLRKQVTSKVGDPIDEKQLFTDALAIKDLYERKGYRETTVQYVPNVNEDRGQGAVTFEIAESPKVRIKAVNFEGASAFKIRKLRKTIKTQNRWAFSWLTGSGIYKEDQFLEDREKLRDLYYKNGYLDFAIKDVRFDYTEPDRMVITIEIFEGQQYQVGDLRIEGNKIFPTEQILFKQTRKGPVSRLAMRSGDVFTPQGFDDNNQAITDLYESEGYLSPRNQGDTRVFPVQSANTKDGTMDLNYQIEEGQKSYIEKIEIRGNTKTKDKVIRRELAVTPGESFNMTRARLSQTRLQGLQYFDEVGLSAEPTDIPDRKNLIVKVTEKAQGTGNFVVGAGFNSVENLVGFIELSQGNFDISKPPLFQGGGQKLRLRTQIGTQRQDYLITFIEPWLFDQKLELETSLFHREFNFLSSLFNETRTGGTVGLRKTLFGSDFIIGGVSYTLEQVEISDVQPGSLEFKDEEKEGKRLVSKIGASLSYDTRGGGLLPNTGQITRLSSEVAGGPFGADTDFYKIELGTKHYFKGFAEGHVLEIQGEIGVVEEYGDTERVPLFDRNFLGGLYSLRGFRFRSVGPKDESGEPIGGRTSWFASAEYSVPIIERFRLAVFYDIGMVHQDAYSFSPVYHYRSQTNGSSAPPTGNTGTYNDNIGIGMRLNLPIGPLRLDYGIPLTSDSENDGSGRFNFGVGWERPF